MIYTYYSKISKKLHNTLIQKTLSEFPVDYQYRILSYRRWQEAQSSLLGRLLLRYGLQTYGYTNCQINYTKYKKPYFNNNPIRFNISHSGRIVICSITTWGNIGIDIEKMKPIDINDFRKQMTMFEWNTISNSENVRSAFYDYWTRKEAVIKANGKGLYIPLNSFNVISLKAVLENQPYFLKELEISENYKCHLAILGIETVNSTKKIFSNIHEVEIQNLI